MTPPPTKLHELDPLVNQDRARSFPRSTDNNKAERVSETLVLQRRNREDKGKEGSSGVELDAHAPFNHRRDSSIRVCFSFEFLYLLVFSLALCLRVCTLCSFWIVLYLSYNGLRFSLVFVVGHCKGLV
ncbi:hypothetical protein Bca52824_022734 [Brassica carinata]|uniref:Transmembrane protein n=1 Tax=Brassica carinata TaxID=52824 RepID=A0A8X7VH93_BRACI|nr:hypothetical protein Bca52824_022734 [Brassica carinata]